MDVYLRLWHGMWVMIYLDVVDIIYAFGTQMVTVLRKGSIEELLYYLYNIFVSGKKIHLHIKKRNPKYIE